MNRINRRKFFQLFVLLGILLVAAFPAQAKTGFAPEMLSIISSDDFNSCVLNSGLWTFVDPVGDSSNFMNGQQLELSVPAGTNHDAWVPNEAARMMQSSDNVDFEIELKFDSPLTLRYQLQGVLIEQDSDNFIRFDFYSDGIGTRNYAATITNGSVSTKKNTIISTGNPLFLRVQRVGDQWTQDYSTDGQSWTNHVTFTHPLTVNAVGPFAGNFSSRGDAPAHTALVDYFFNTASPINPEDPDDNTININITGSGSVNLNPDQAAYACGEVVTFNASPVPGWLFSNWAGDLTGNNNPETLVVSGDHNVNAIFSIDNDTTPPVLSNIQANPLDSSAVITWTTDELADSSVAHGPTAAYELGSVSDPASVTSHSITLNGLTPDTTYHYQVTSTDPSGNSASSTDLTFTTASASDTTPPVLSNIQASPQGTSATITWNTDELADSSVAHGPTPAYEHGSVSDSAFVTSHSITLTGLTPDTTYHYQVTSSDTSGNTASSSDLIFTTSPDTTPPVLSNIQASPQGTSATITWNTNELADSSVAHGPTAAYELGSVSDPAFVTAHSIALNGLTPNTPYHYQVTSSDPSGNSANSSDLTFVTSGASSPVIDIWYGNNQDFGQQGTPQQYLNILGNVFDPDGVTSLTYSLNGGPQKNLSIGPDSRRLAYPGDFNVDLSISDVNTGVNQVVITATDSLNNQAIESVTVDYDPGNSWPIPYSIDWSTVSNIQDVAQVVDGKWEIDNGNLRISSDNYGYDRLIAIGDLSWNDYQISVPVTINSVDPAGYNPPSNSPGLGVIFRWTGHTDDPVGGSQPKAGWFPLGAIGWNRWNNNGNGGRLQIYGNYGTILDGARQKLVEGVTYIYKFRVETIAGQGGLYSFKVWEAGQSEPPGWTMTGQETLSDPQNGSILLISHHVDASFGDIQVLPLSDSTPPVLTNIQTNPGDTQATITWVTDELADSRIDYGTTSGYELGFVDDPSFVTSHSIILNGLTPDTTYHIQISSTDPSGNTASSNDLTFTTTAPDTTPPVLSNIQSAQQSTSATISWATDELADSSVAHGTTSGYELGAVDDPSYVTIHSIALTGLLPDTTYHFQVSSADPSGNSASSVDLTFTTDIAPPVSSPISDDFNDLTLNTDLWSFIDPVGDSSYFMNGAQLELTVQAGTSHDPWNPNESARMVQSIDDVDFEVEIKFDSPLSQRYQIQGLLIEQDADDFTRFDFYSDGNNIRIYAATFTNGSVSVKNNVTIPDGNPLYMRVQRLGDQWTQSYSFDGQNWITTITFNHALSVISVGPFAGNQGRGSAVPAHTALVDYFINTADPLN